MNLGHFVGSEDLRIDPGDSLFTWHFWTGRARLGHCHSSSGIWLQHPSKEKRLKLIQRRRTPPVASAASDTSIDNGGGRNACMTQRGTEILCPITGGNFAPVAGIQCCMVACLSRAALLWCWVDRSQFTPSGRAAKHNPLESARQQITEYGFLFSAEHAEAAASLFKGWQFIQ
jgi:hypothetical protein